MDQVSEARAARWFNGRDVWRPIAREPALALWLIGSLLAWLLAGVNVAAGIVAAIVVGASMGVLGLINRHNDRSNDLSRSHQIATKVVATNLAIAHWLDQHELHLLFAFSPFFLVPLRPFFFVIALVPLLSLARWLARGYVTHASPLNIPILALLVMLAPSFLVAADLDLAFVKLVGLLFGVGLYLAILNLPTHVSVHSLGHALALAGFMLALILLSSTDWPVVGKLSIYASIYAALPRMIHDLPRAVSISTDINPNEAAGALDWVAPYLIALWLGQQQLARRDGNGWLWQLFLMTAVMFSSATLFLTQSRGAIVAFTLALLSLIAIYARLLRWLLLAAVPIALLMLLIFSAGTLNEPVGGAEPDKPGATAELNLHGRQIIWQQAIESIRRYPLVGVGLNNFDLMHNHVGIESPPEWQQRLIVHAHNSYLQAAVDFGLPGLVAYMALLVSAFGLCLRLMRGDRPREVKILATAIGVGLLAHQIFGLTDAITLGAKPGFIFWSFLGALAWLFAHGHDSA